MLKFFYYTRNRSKTKTLFLVWRKQLKIEQISIEQKALKSLQKNTIKIISADKGNTARMDFNTYDQKTFIGRTLFKIKQKFNRTFRTQNL